MRCFRKRPRNDQRDGAIVTPIAFFRGNWRAADLGTSRLCTVYSDTMNRPDDEQLNGCRGVRQGSPKQIPLLIVQLRGPLVQGLSSSVSASASHVYETKPSDFICFSVSYVYGHSSYAPNTGSDLTVTCWSEGVAILGSIRLPLTIMVQHLAARPAFSVSTLGWHPKSQTRELRYRSDSGFWASPD